MDRRAFMRASAGAAAVLGGGAVLSGCAAIGIGAEAGEDAAVSNPATSTWLSDIAKAVAATELAKFLNDGGAGLSSYWRDWLSGVQNQAHPYKAIWPDCWGHEIPPVALIHVSEHSYPLGSAGDPMSDGLLACVNNGSESVYFEPWAWQALAMYVQKMTNGLTGQNLANAQRVCVNGLIPSGQSPQTGGSPGGLAGWMTYDTRSGPVEMAKLQGADGSYTATVEATGIWDINQQPLKQTFTLPTHSA